MWSFWSPSAWSGDPPNNPHHGKATPDGSPSKVPNPVVGSGVNGVDL